MTPLNIVLAQDFQDGFMQVRALNFSTEYMNIPVVFPQAFCSIGLQLASSPWDVILPTLLVRPIFTYVSFLQRMIS